MEEKREKKRGRRGRRGRRRTKVCFFLWNQVSFGMFRVIGMIARVFLWRLVCSKPRVLVERSHKPLIC